MFGGGCCIESLRILGVYIINYGEIDYDLFDG
jgi:hypothetical protein